MSVTYEYYSPQRFGDPTTLTTTPVNLYTFDQKSIIRSNINYFHVNSCSYRENSDIS